jgi:cobalamin biosynthesis Mg chelatase CobN
MTLREMVSETRMDEVCRVSAVDREEIEQLLGRLDRELPEMLKQVICTYGYQLIDEEPEREELARIIMDGLAMVIPPQYAVVWSVLRPTVRQLVLQILEEAAGQGAAYCDGVRPALLPFPVRT